MNSGSGIVASGKGKIQSYKQLEVWKKGILLVEKVYDLTEKFPRQELYGLANQMRKSAVSIPSNIAEGFARNFTKEYLRFLYFSLGSCAELETQLMIAKIRKYGSDLEIGELEREIDYESRMLMNLIKALKKRVM